MNTTQLECFVTVANFLNFSRAAEHLRITQPAVSHQINTLEDELGVKLFHRTSKSVRLTQEGYMFTQYAGEILKISEFSKARLKEMRQITQTRLMIGCRNTAELRLIVPALTKLRELNPEVLPILRLIPHDTLESLLSDGELHVIFTFEKDTVPPKARYRELLRCQPVCVFHPEHPLAKYESLTLEQLREAGRIATCRPPVCPPPLFAIQSLVTGSRETPQIMFCDNQELLIPLVLAGYAFSVSVDMPNTLPPELVKVPLSEFDPLSFGALYLPESGGAARLFLDLFEKSLNEPQAGHGKEAL